MEFGIANRHPRLADPETAARRLLEALQQCGAFPLPVDGELSLAFVDDTAIAEVHGRFMDDPTPTDVITFPPDSELESAGEIIVSADRAAEVAEELDTGLSHELCLYIVHGWLHLAGYDDRSEAARKRMRAAETQAIGLVEHAGALPKFGWR